MFSSTRIDQSLQLVPRLERSMNRELESANDTRRRSNHLNRIAFPPRLEADVNVHADTSTKKFPIIVSLWFLFRTIFKHA